MCFISRYPFSSLMRVFQRNTTNPRQVPRRCLPLGKSTDCKKRSASLLRSYPRASFHSFPGFPSVASVRETCGTAPIQVGPETDVDNSFADFRFSLFYSTFFFERSAHFRDLRALLCYMLPCLEDSAREYSDKFTRLRSA